MLKPDSYMFNKWSRQAVECFNRHCMCQGCDLELFCMEQERDNTYNMIPMKWAVLMSVTRLGIPNEEIEDEFDE